MNHHPIARYLSMIRFAHSIFALPLAGIAFVQALVHSPLGNDVYEIILLLIKVILCMVFLRSSAMGFNRLVDRKYDAANPRTAGREIPAGLLSPKHVRLFVLICALGFGLTAYSINWLTAILSPLALALVCGYSYTKRFSSLSHFVLGLAIGLAPTATWIAVLENIALLPLLWSAGLMFYVAGFDMLYACQDHEFDRRMGLHSLPARLGIAPALWLARLCHLLALFFFVWAGLEQRSGPSFFIAAVVVAILFLFEHVLVRPNALNTLRRIPVAFFHINASISAVLLGGVLLDTYVG